MLRFTSLKDAYPICAAIGSPLRLEILELLLLGVPLNIETIAKRLHLTSGALTRHIKILEDADLIQVKTMPLNRGHQKLCSMNFDKIIIELPTGGALEKSSIADVPIGLFSDYNVKGRCGLASKDGFIGSRDSVTAFLNSSRATTNLLWLEKGYLTYLLPPFNEYGNSADKNKALDELRISLEISPDFIGNDTISRGSVSFFIDALQLGTIWLTTPSDKRRGYLTPTWHDSTLPQYGILKLVRICHDGTYIDGEKTSSITINDIKKAKSFTIATETGLTLFGQNFGDYGQGIKFF